MIAILTLALIVPAVGGPMTNSRIVLRGDTVELRLARSEDDANTSAGADIPEVIGQLWGEEFREALIERKAKVLLPRWVPEGYEVDETNWYPDNNAASSLLLRGDELLKIVVHVIPNDADISTSVQVESEPGSEETWKLGGISYIYTTNYERCNVSWIENNCIVVISAPRDRETMRRMIESIYE